MLRVSAVVFRRHPVGAATIRRHKLNLEESLAASSAPPSSSARITAGNADDDAVAVRESARIARRRAELLKVDPDEVEAETRALVSEARTAGTWNAAAKLLHSLVASRNAVLPREVLEAATDVIALSRSAEQCGESQRGAVARLLGGDDAIDGESVAVWPLEAEEIRAATFYVAAARRRVSELTTSIDETGALQLSGGSQHAPSDDRFVRGLLGAVEKRSAEDGTQVSIATLANLSKTRISWQSSMALLDVARRNEMQPLSEMYTEAIVACRRHRQWEHALTAFVDCALSGVEPEADAYTFMLAALAEESARTALRQRGAVRSHMWRAASFVWKMAAGAVDADALSISGESGAALLSQSVLMAATLRNWALALGFVAQMDIEPRPTHNMVLPTADAVLHAVACCIASEQNAPAERLIAAGIALRAFNDASPGARIAVLRAIASLPRVSNLNITVLESLFEALLDQAIILGHAELDALGAALFAASRRVFADIGTRPQLWEAATRAFIAKECLTDLAPPTSANEYLRRLVNLGAFARAMESNPGATQALVDHCRLMHDGKPLYDIFFVPMWLRAAARAGDWATAMQCFLTLQDHPQRPHADVSMAAMAERVVSAFSRTDVETRKSVLPRFLAAVTAAFGAPPPHLTLQGVIIAQLAPGRIEATAGQSWMEALKHFASGPTQDVTRTTGLGSSARRLVSLLQRVRAINDTWDSSAPERDPELSLVAHHPTMFATWSDATQPARFGPLLSESL